MAFQANEPESIVIYTIGDGTARMIGARRNQQKWSFGRWVEIPENQLNDFIHERMEAGAQVLDCRLSANLKTPGMGRATPIVIAQGIAITVAVEAASQIHDAILSTTE